MYKPLKVSNRGWCIQKMCKPVWSLLQRDESQQQDIKTGNVQVEVLYK